MEGMAGESADSTNEDFRKLSRKISVESGYRCRLASSDDQSDLPGGLQGREGRRWAWGLVCEFEKGEAERVRVNTE